MMKQNIMALYDSWCDQQLQAISKNLLKLVFTTAGFKPAVRLTTHSRLFVACDGIHAPFTSIMACQSSSCQGDWLLPAAVVLHDKHHSRPALFW